MNAIRSFLGEKWSARMKWVTVTAGLCVASLLAGWYARGPGKVVGPRADQNEVARAQTPADMEEVTPYSPIVTHSEGSYTPELVRVASRVLGGYTLSIRDLSPRYSKKVFLVSVMRGRQGIFMERGGTYVQVDSGSELIAINEILAEYEFTRRDFDIPQKVDSFLGDVAMFHDGPIGFVIGSSFRLRIMGPLEDWLRGSEKSEAALRELCKDPEFVFDHDVWTVVFNLIRSDGALERWRVVGEHDQRANTNTIWGIRIVPVRPPGTFTYPLFG